MKTKIEVSVNPNGDILVGSAGESYNSHDADYRYTHGNRSHFFRRIGGTYNSRTKKWRFEKGTELMLIGILEAIYGVCPPELLIYRDAHHERLRAAEAAGTPVSAPEQRTGAPGAGLALTLAAVAVVLGVFATVV